MQPAPIPLNEAERLASLYALKILDTAPEERYDRLTRLAQQLFGVPIALISLIDAERQWFKSKQGTDLSEGSRSTSFCGHAILSADPMVIPDATQDPRFSDNPNVLGDFNVRFYAGAPVEAPDGARLGTLCLIDHKPRVLDGKETQLLRDLAALVQDEVSLVEIGLLHQAIERSRALAGELKEAENRFEVVFRGAPVGIALVNPRRRIIESNPALQSLLGYDAADLEGMQLSELLAFPREASEKFSEMIAGRLPNFEAELTLVKADDSELDRVLSFSLVRNALGEPHHLVMIVPVV